MVGSCTNMVTLLPENCKGGVCDQQYHCLPQYVLLASVEELNASESEGGIKLLMPERGWGRLLPAPQVPGAGGGLPQGACHYSTARA